MPLPAGQEEGRRAAGTALKAVFDDLGGRYPERAGALEQASLALLAQEHLLIFGPPGTGKSELAAAVLRRFVDAAGRPSLWARQIVETTVQTDLVGPVDFKTLTETGRTVYHLDEGILNAEHAVLDEVFDGRDLLLRSLLSVLNERELALGASVHKARLCTAVLTTNRYLSEVLHARPETLVAFADRIAFACFVPKAFASAASRATLLRHAAEPPLSAPRIMALSDLKLLQEAAREVRVPEDVRTALAALVDVFGRMLQEATAERKGYAPTCYLSPRTLAKSVGVVRAAVARDRYVEGRDRPPQATVADLACLRWMFALGGPPADDLGKVVQATPDPRERWQLENIRLEAGAFERALAVVVSESQRRAADEAQAMGLPEMRVRLRQLTPATASELALLSFEARAQAHSEALRVELDAMAQAAARAFAAGARAGAIPPLPLGEREPRLRARLSLARALEGPAERRALAQDIARQGVIEAAGALQAMGDAESGGELEVGGAVTLTDLAQRAVGVGRQIGALEELGGGLEALLAAREARPLREVAREARRRMARSLRRRAMVLLGGRSRDAAGFKVLAALSRAAAELDRALDALSPGEGTVASQVLAGRAGLLLAAELERVESPRLSDFVAALRRGLERLEALSVERWRALRVCRPVVERRLRGLLAAPDAAMPGGLPSEQGYRALVEASLAGSDRAALQELTAVLLREDPLAARADARLAELELHELSLRVGYLGNWLAEVAASVPAPGELESREQAEAACALVNASRFFAVGWHEGELAAIRERVAQLGAVPALAERSRQALARAEALAASADRFGRALLERRAELAA